MCRLLLVKSKKEFDIVPHLKKLAEISKNSKEYQGHGWGCAYLQNGNWKFYKNILPIWENDLKQFGKIKTKQLIAHTRSAYKDEGIKIENNMPFYDNKYVFIFNGELQGVRIKESGRIGAEKIFNFIKGFDRGNFLKALKESIAVIKKRTKYIKAMNIIISDKEKIYVVSMFNENPYYFTMHYKQNDLFIICSEEYPNEKGWGKIKNNTIKVFK